MQRQTVLGAAAVLAIAGSAFAGGVINDGTAPNAASFLVGFTNSIGFTAYPFSAPNGEGNFVLNGAANAAGGFNINDILARNQWYARGEIPGNSGSASGNRMLSWLNSPAESYVGNLATVNYPGFFLGNVSLPRVDLKVEIVLADGADAVSGVSAGSATVVQRVTITNIVGAGQTVNSPVTVFLYNITAMQLFGSGQSGNDTISFVAGDQTYHRVTDGANPSLGFVEVRGVGATLGQAGAAANADVFSGFPGSTSGPFPTTTLSGANSLAGGGTSINGTASAFQWNITLQPGETRVITQIIAVNGVASVVTRCNPADIADNGSNPGFDGCVDNGDFSLFISEFFNAGIQAACTGATIPCAVSDIADNGSNPGADGLLDNGDFSLFISSFFGASCASTCTP
jgi:hypothetical protein